MVGCTDQQPSPSGASQAAALPPASPLAGTWALHIEGLNHATTDISVQFSDVPADSCISGDWKRLVVESPHKPDDSVFPASQPLSYTFDGHDLTIGRNEMCDAYLHLIGSLKNSAVEGEYVSMGLGGAQHLGVFTLHRRQ